MIHPLLLMISVPIDALARSVQDSSTFNHIGKITQITMEALSPKTSFVIYGAFDKLNGLVSGTSWVGSLNKTISNLVILCTSTQPIDPIEWVLGEGVNVAMLISNVRGALDYLERLAILDLGMIAEKMGSIPIFGAVVEFFLLPGIKNTFAVVAFTIDIGKQCLEIGRQIVAFNPDVGPNLLYTAIAKLTGDVAKITVIVLSSAVIVRALSSGCSILSFLLESHRKNPFWQANS